MGIKKLNGHIFFKLAHSNKTYIDHQNHQKLQCHHFSGKNELVSPCRLIQFKVLNINCYSFSHLFYTQSEQLNIRITHLHRYNSADLQIANKTIIEAIKTLLYIGNINFYFSVNYCLQKMIFPEVY